MASTLIARRLGRITFGGVLLVGLAYLLFDACSLTFYRHSARGLDAATTLAITWIAAFVISAVVRAVVSRTPLRCNPDALFAESLMAPVVGLALVLPITLHLPFALLISGSDGFDFWVQVSIWITGLTHVVFAGMCAARAHQLATGKPAWTPRRIYVVTILVSCVPFVILWAIPPVLVAVTALPFLPILRGLGTLAERERDEMATVPHVLPRAVAVRPSA